MGARPWGAGPWGRGRGGGAVGAGPWWRGRGGGAVGAGPWGRGRGGGAVGAGPRGRTERYAEAQRKLWTLEQKTDVGKLEEVGMTCVYRTTPKAGVPQGVPNGDFAPGL
ncbi:hypothetical protein NHX12_031382 [Muraenolepis orangiensis]|uniref:Uncharacterized protein n=1 Tax=Muraenolepis orangiensis TaxID=630683 RepID=A0A9Q0E5S3_9TELE|nr:hypothetical protein NHX12_031382 [Muraenolepis orangiensis]